MKNNIAKNAVKRTSHALLASVFSGFGRISEKAAHTIFSSVVSTGSALVKDIASDIDGDETSKKGLQEKVSGWLDRYDFVSPIRNYLWREGLKLVERNTVIAIDSGDISKEFGGAGMEGMEMGYDASRGVIVMGHSLLCAAVVMRTRAVTLRLDLMRGRKGLPDAEIAMYDAIINEVNDYGIIVLDMGFDSEGFIPHNLYSKHCSVIRIKEMKRDVFWYKTLYKGRIWQVGRAFKRQ